jgi:hypothetical protein
LSFLLTLQGMIATAFVVALLLGLLLPNRWKTIGWALAAVAAGFAAVRLTVSADQPCKFWISDMLLFGRLWAVFRALRLAAGFTGVSAARNNLRHAPCRKGVPRGRLSPRCVTRSTIPQLPMLPS